MAAAQPAEGFQPPGHACLGKPAGCVRVHGLADAGHSNLKGLIRLALALNHPYFFSNGFGGVNKLITFVLSAHHPAIPLGSPEQRCGALPADPEGDARLYGQGRQGDVIRLVVPSDMGDWLA